MQSRCAGFSATFLSHSWAFLSCLQCIWCGTYLYEWSEGFGIVILKGSGGGVERKKISGSLQLAMTPHSTYFIFTQSTVCCEVIRSAILATAWLLIMFSDAERTSWNIYTTGYALSEYRQTSIHTFQWLLEYTRLAISGKNWNCAAHFRYRGSIEYCDTWDGIVIVAPISGIAQHYCIVVIKCYTPSACSVPYTLACKSLSRISRPLKIESVCCPISLTHI